MSNVDLAVAQIVSAIISKEKVEVLADNENGVLIGIRKTSEKDPNFQSALTLEDLIIQVNKAFK
ncbi:hypothetical protein HHO41_21505 [Bacillus sp. DNRA2]|uniref:hypothetical protein n=1 Tax=Bacillus sp. DNRA2 TaxID=2723053 RepID=UPI00145CF140|nr:hypothetical protein [Bacillus sp. DNRA2]NMD72802.1 hypothetical protein [Bacillus sp. DNRA2]